MLIGRKYSIKTKLTVLAFVIVVLGIIMLIVWSIYRLFTWLF